MIRIGAGSVRRRLPRRRGVAAVVAVVAGMLIGIGGCTADGADRTGGLSFRYERREEPVGMAVWTLQSDGILRYAGGRDAVLGRETWRGPLSESDLERLRSLASDLVSAPPEPDATAPGDASGVRPRLDRHPAAGRVRIRRAGDPPALEPMLRILREVSSARLVPALERLPRPTEPAGGAPGP